MAAPFKSMVLRSILGIFALGALGYAILVLANLKDRDPSGEIAMLESMLERSSPVASEDNSYIYMLGIEGPPDSNPMALGLERYEWMETARPEFSTDDDPLGIGYDFESKRSEAVALLAKTCSESESECLALLESDEETVEQWLTDERWLLDRYRTLIALPVFRESVPFDVFAPLPSYNVILQGQRLHILDAWTAAGAGDAARVSATLDRDLTYWRMVLENSDALITKMIATAAIIRHFKLGNLVLRRLPQDVADDAIPPSWRAELTESERSMQRSLAGEWKYFDDLMKKTVTDMENPFDDWTGLADTTTWERIKWVVLKPMWQPQDLTNRYARMMLDLGNAFDVPYEDIPNAVDIAEELQASAFKPFSRLYNFAGDLAMFTDGWSLSSYAVRVSDLEGIRRAALLVAELRADGVTANDVVQRMLVSEIVHPYTNEPFAWDDSGVMVFKGLEPHEDRSRHELIY
ncbi:MAG: hypothetical protein QNJ00_05955 [Woeseiaceae bacterium]|nr:hypothetical protein [Woeseiaceae bacterium]